MTSVQHIIFFHENAICENSASSLLDLKKIPLRFWCSKDFRINFYINNINLKKIVSFKMFPPTYMNIICRFFKSIIHF